MDLSTNVIAGCAFLTIIGGLFVWATKATLAPFKVLITNLNEAIVDLKILVKAHSDKIGNQEVRLAQIETKHSVRHKGE